MDIPSSDRMFLPGQCSIDELQLISYNGFTIDLRNHFLEIAINESIDYASVSGTVTIADNLNFMRHVPLIGNEKIRISFHTAGKTKKITHEFFCFKIDNRNESKVNKNAAVYDLHFVSAGYMNSLKTKISRSFVDMRFSEMVQTIYRDSYGESKPIFVQQTHGKKNFVLPYMTPANAIYTLAKISMSDDLKDTAYIFYEDLDRYFFGSLNYFAQKTSVAATYTWQQPGMSGEDNSRVLRNLAQEFFRIESYKILKFSNTIHNVENGLFGSTALIVDNTFKSVDAQTFSYNNDFYSLNTLNRKGLLPRTGDNFSDYTMAKYHVLPRQSFGYENLDKNEDHESVYLNRSAYMAQLENMRLTILVAGDSSRRIGEKIRVEIPSIGPKNKTTELYDPYLSGTYIISQITHIIQRGQYKMRFVLDSDSLDIPYPEKKTLEYTG